MPIHSLDVVGQIYVYMVLVVLAFILVPVALNACFHKDEKNKNKSE